MEVLNTDYRAVPVRQGDVVYFDPPYTKRQYAAYYHLIETITAGDTPKVAGVTGLRPWEAKASPYCYSMKALKEFAAYLEEIYPFAAALLVSYSSDGHMKHPDLAELLRSYGRTAVQEFSVGRYSSNAPRGGGARIVERLYVTHFGASQSLLSA